MEFQTRFAPLTETKTREGVIEGHASVFDVVDSHKTVLEQGSFSRTLADWNSRGEMPGLFMQHDYSMPLGVWESMTEDNYGLRSVGRLAKSSIGDHVAELFDMKAIRGLSIGFVPQKWREDRSTGITYYQEVKLIEASVVTQPSNRKASAMLRSEDARALITTVRDFEAFLQDSGFSARAAKSIAATGFKAADDRDDPAHESASQLRDEGEQIPPEQIRSIIDWANSILKGSN